MTVNVQRNGSIWTVQINRPEARNAVNPATATLLFEAFLEFDADPNAVVAIFTGDQTAFCAGFDLKEAAEGMTPAWMTKHQIPEDWSDPVVQPLPGPMGPSRLQLSKPVIAAIEGPAVAGGMELALWSDIRIASTSAYFGIYCRRWGVPLIDGGTVRLPAVVGQGRATDLVLTGRQVEAEEAYHIGLANRLCEPGKAYETALDYAENILRFPQGCMLSDHRSARPTPEQLAKALRREWCSADLILNEGAAGASRFSSGKGRGGNFGDI